MQAQEETLSSVQSQLQQMVAAMEQQEKTHVTQASELQAELVLAGEAAQALSGCLASHEAEIADLQNQLAASQAAKHSLEEANATQTAELSSLSAQLWSTTSMLHDVQLQLTAKVTDAEQLQQRLTDQARLQRQLQHDHDEHVAELSQVRSDLGSSQLATRSLEKQLATASTDVTQLQDHTSDLTGQKLLLEAEHKSQAEQLTDFSSQLQHARQEGRQLRTQLAEKDQHMTNLQADHERQQSRLRGQRVAQAEELAELRNQLAARHELTEELQAKLAEANTSRLHLQSRYCCLMHQAHARCTSAGCI